MLLCASDEEIAPILHQFQAQAQGSSQAVKMISLVVYCSYSMYIQVKTMKPNWTERTERAIAALAVTEKIKQKNNEKNCKRKRMSSHDHMPILSVLYGGLVYGQQFRVSWILFSYFDVTYIVLHFIYLFYIQRNKRRAHYNTMECKSVLMPFNYG